MEMKIENAVIAVRISSTKQGLQGDSPEAQKEQIERFAKQHNIRIKKFFKFVESASGEEQPLQEVVDYCKDPKNDIQLFLIKSIDRFTRGGSYFYDHLKMQLTRYGVKLVDLYGVIGTQTVNTLEHLGVKYDWSVYSPTKKSEILEAERAKDDVRDSLTRMIGAEIRYLRLGYWIGFPQPGYINKRIETPHGMRVILEPHPIESQWFIRMFELKMQGNLTDEEIVEKINLMGYKSRRLRKHDIEDKSKIVGYMGEKQLTVKHFQRVIKNPIYAGLIVRKWTDYKPKKAQFPGLVTIEMFNKANRNKVTIVEDGGNLTLIKGKLPTWQLKKNKDNPDYPYKKQVLCPICRSPLLGSAPRNRQGRHIPRYHCARGHKYWSVNRKIFNETIKNFVSQITFTPQYKEKFRKILLEEWEKREKKTSQDSITLYQRISLIEGEKQMLKEKIKTLTSSIAIKMIEDDIDELENKKAQVIANCNQKEDEQLDIQTAINFILFFMERFEDLILGGSNPLMNAAMFGLLCDTPPTYKDLVNGTPKLSLLFALKSKPQSLQEQCVSRRGLEPLTVSLRGRCSTN